MKRPYIAALGPIVILTVCALASAALQTGPKEERVKPSQLPAPVAQALKTNCPNCVIDKATREVENGVTIYDIEFKSGQGEMDVAEDGSVIDRETVVRQTDVPPPAMEAIRKAGGKIRQIAKDEVLAELKDGTVIKLDNPRDLYEADLVKGNQVAEIQVTPEGQVTEAPMWRSRGSKEN